MAWDEPDGPVGSRSEEVYPRRAAPLPKVSRKRTMAIDGVVVATMAVALAAFLFVQFFSDWYFAHFLLYNPLVLAIVGAGVVGGTYLALGGGALSPRWTRGAMFASVGGGALIGFGAGAPYVPVLSSLPPFLVTVLAAGTLAFVLGMMLLKERLGFLSIWLVSGGLFWIVPLAGPV